jgi:hypothetical protein
MALFLEIPTGRFRTEVYLYADEDWSNHGASEHQSPVEILADVEKSRIDDVSQHYTESSPHLPHHHEGASDGSG